MCVFGTKYFTCSLGLLRFTCTHSVGRQRTSPKIHNLIEHLPIYLAKQQHSLHRCHEQAFETFHKKFRDFEKTIPFPKVGFWVPPKPKSTSTSSSDSVSTNTPSYCTRSGTQRKRQKLQSKRDAAKKREESITALLLSMAPEPILVSPNVDTAEFKDSDGTPRLTNISNIDKAQKGRLLAISSWNAKRFDDNVSLQRLLTASKFKRGDPNAPWNKEF
jgi:hypothetical protein